ncbi:dihydrofolate reductase [Actinomyces radicidentis]|uniref:dihydrofolate reductase n=1 Tax=Actinomyces radicidentis TaxID=111015 RepID=UPI000AABC97B|nr:dihydrofolate reductase [Actinomyces radicidentis]
MGAIWAQDPSGIIGADGTMLWRVPGDFAHFRATTLGGVIVMGRTTWDSIGAALPGRTSVVLTRRPGWSADGVAAVAGGLPEALGRARELAAALPEDPRDEAHRPLPRTWVIGGGTVYRQALEERLLDEVLVSTIDVDAACVARERGLPGSALVRVPTLEAPEWVRDAATSDPDGAWRESRGTRWRLDRLTRS